MISQIKSFLLRTVPMPYIWAKDAMGRLYEPDVRALMLQRYAHTVADGPFAGMRYIDRSTCGALTPKLVGTYERELRGVVDRVIHTGYDRIVVVGSAEGYYAVGFARAMPHVRVDAYDIDERARRNLHELATLNGTLDRTTIRETCTHADFEQYRSESVLVVCDIEGAELDLLDPEAAPSLRGYDVIVEIHDGAGSTRVRDTLAQRFSASHEIGFIRYTGRADVDVPALPRWLPPRARALALSEDRIPDAPSPTGLYGVEWGVFSAGGRRGAGGGKKVG
jgi:hypothetical protein